MATELLREQPHYWPLEVHTGLKMRKIMQLIWANCNCAIASKANFNIFGGLFSKYYGWGFFVAE